MPGPCAPDLENALKLPANAYGLTRQAWIWGATDLTSCRSDGQICIDNNHICRQYDGYVYKIASNAKPFIFPFRAARDWQDNLAEICSS
jgi:hypothetical protein